MFCPDKLKVNKLAQVDLPKPCDMFASYGLKDCSGLGYSGERSVERSMTKTEELSKIQSLERKRLVTEESQSED